MNPLLEHVAGKISGFEEVTVPSRGLGVKQIGETDLLPPLLPEKHQVHFSSRTDNWSTPKDFYQRLNKKFQFGLDVCANAQNACAPKYLSKEQDGLVQPWHQYTGNVWMNPPYGKHIGKWMKKMVDEHVLAPYKTFVALVPARTDTRWWHDFVVPYATEIIFVRGRLHFGNAKTSAPFPSAVIVYRHMTKEQTYKVMKNHPDKRKTWRKLRARNEKPLFPPAEPRFAPSVDDPTEDGVGGGAHAES